MADITTLMTLYENALILYRQEILLLFIFSGRSIATFSFLTQKLFDRFAHNLKLCILK